MKLEGGERKILKTILELQGNSSDFVNDAEIAEAARMFVIDVRDWMETLAGKEFIEHYKGIDGFSAHITAKGRQALRLSEPMPTSEPSTILESSTWQAETIPQRASSTTIKRGDRLILKQYGMEIPVVAASSEHDGTIQIKYSGVFSTVAVSDVRLLDEDGVVAISGNQPDVLSGAPPCARCGQFGISVPPGRADPISRTLEVEFRCPNGHYWKEKYPLS